MRAARALALAGGLLACAASALGVLACLRHEGARVAWARESSRLEGDRGAYSAARSDVLYAGLEAHRDEAERAGGVAALAVLIALAGLGATRGPITAGAAAPLRAWASVLLDAGCLAGAALALTLARDALGAEHAAFGALGERIAAGAMAGLAWASLASGATPGQRLVRLRVHAKGRAPGLARALPALAFSPLALFAAPFALARSILAGGRAEKSTPFHLRWAGLEIARRA